MTTRFLAFPLTLLVCSTAAAAALAQDTTGQGEQAPAAGMNPTDSAGIVGPLPPVRGSLTCYKLVDEPKFCVLPETLHVVDYSIPWNIIDLNGAWVGPSGERPYIYLYNQPSAGSGYSIAFDMSLVNRPDGFGYFVNGSTISAVFPDDRDYTGSIEADGLTIRWSNNTVWNKL